MIDLAEIHRRAANLRVPELTVERDYVLSHLLIAFAEETRDLVFRGGTALARLYWPDFRLSEDLDFIVDGSLPNLGALVERVVGTTHDRTQLQVEADVGQPRDGWSRSIIRWESAEVLVDVNLGERAYLPVETRTPTISYSDLAQSISKVRAVSLAEILGNKWYMLTDRIEPRDLFDVWSAIVRGVPFDEVVRGHRAKYGFSPVEVPRKRLGLFQPLWEARLSHQVADLPPFADVVTDINEAHREWAKERE